MNQKLLGSILIVIGILILILTAYTVSFVNNNISRQIQEQNGSCYLEDGTCLHEEGINYLYYSLIGYISGAALVLLGLYIVFFDKSHEVLMKQNKEVSEALKEARKKSDKDSQFNAYLAGFDEDKQKILKAVHEQEGILQSTLRYRTGMSKSYLSLQLKELEEKEIISRKPEGKTNKVFLRKKF